jgi:hypothetical protein
VQAARDPPCGQIKCPREFPRCAVAGTEDAAPKYGAGEAKVGHQQRNVVSLPIIRIRDVETLNLGFGAPI